MSNFLLLFSINLSTDILFNFTSWSEHIILILFNKILNTFEFSSTAVKWEAPLLKDSIPKPGQIAYTRQLEPLGLGHAIWCARNFVGSEPVAVLLADDLILSEKGCLKQMIEAYDEIGGNMLAVMEVVMALLK